MKKQDFYFELPEELIAQYPLEKRSDAKLLHYCRDTQKSQHHQVFDLVKILRPGDLLVFNDTKVIPARLFGQKQTGGQVELLVERVVSNQHFWAHIRASKAPKPGSIIELEKNWSLRVEDKVEDLYRCTVVSGEIDALLESIGHIPLPLYIERSSDVSDHLRYQTVYAKNKGAVAAPTAGFHFDEPLMKNLAQMGVQFGYVTLHIGSGTFRPVRTEQIESHKMHSEWFEVSESLCQQIKQTKANHGRVIAVGTTALRSLESAARDGHLCATEGETDIFIYPGFEFRVCDGLMTNFHLPESTLIMLVSAFIGHQQTMALYRTAIEHRYRFYSYGDSSILL